MARLGIGIIGLGLALKPHALSLRDLADRVAVIGGFSPTASRRHQFTTQWGWPTVDSLDALLQDSRVDAVLIPTPPRTHGELALRAARAGKHVLVEKPLDVDWPSARNVVDEVERLGRTFGVVFQHRFRLGAIALRDALRERLLGELVSCSASIRWWRSFEYFAEPGRGTMARDAGGVLLTQAIHTLDLLLDLVGPVRRVTALTRTSPIRAIDTEDVACASVEYENGAVGVIDATTTAYPGYAERIEIAGTKGSALLEGERLVLQRHGADPLVVEGATAGGGGADPMAFSHESHRRLIADFIDALASGRETLASARSALRVHALIDAMLASSKAGEPREAPRTS
ncbi:MAG TPA: Gfo/Idh/MocA family oxidoreductase [Casimicrobiaceae bacterium]|nr:Gfo/Idh/MocA family oxidoreductase [Casimicrobiaceae bacterium]